MNLYNDNCFNVFPKIENKSIDLFVLDLPYANKDFGKCTACKWDNTIDLDKMWVEIKRIMKPGAVILFYCNTKFGFSLIKSNTKWFRYDLIWKKSRKVGFLSANKMPLRQHENIYVFKEKGGTYNPQKTKGKPYIDKRDGQRQQDTVYGKLKHTLEINKGDRHPTSIIEHENVYIFKDKGGTYNPQKTEGKPYNKTNTGNNNNDNCAYGEIDRSSHNKGKEHRSINKGDRHPTSIYPDTIETTILEHNNPVKSLHRTQKPTSLCEWLIKTYSNEGDLVMDFTMGSGTTGEACINTKRNFIGVEMDKEIFKIAKERLNPI